MAFDSSPRTYDALTPDYDDHNHHDHDTPAPSPPRSLPPRPDRHWLECAYASKVCRNVRAVKVGGALHKLCELHRRRASLNQRRLQARRRALRAQLAMIEHTALALGDAVDADSVWSSLHWPAAPQRQPCQQQQQQHHEHQHMHHCGDSAAAACGSLHAPLSCPRPIDWMRAVATAAPVEPSLELMLQSPGSANGSDRDVPDVDEWRVCAISPGDAEVLLRLLVDDDPVAESPRAQQSYGSSHYSDDMAPYAILNSSDASFSGNNDDNDTYGAHVAFAPAVEYDVWL